MKKTDLYGAWIAPNGRSQFPKARRLYFDDDLGDLLWDKGGNDYVGTLDSGFVQRGFGGFSFVSSDKDEVNLVIETGANILQSLALAWGMTVEK